MSRGDQPGRRGRGRLVVASALGLALLGTPAAAVADDPPVIVAASVSPAGLPAEGGLVTIVAEVDASPGRVGIATADATLSSPEGASYGVALVPSGPATFRGTFLVPPNASEGSVNWNVEIWIVDINGADAMTFTGGVEVAGQPQFDEPPLVWDPTVDPATLPSEGGPVTIGVRAWDLRGVTDGSASVTGPDGATASIELQPVSADRFEAVFTAPPNAGPAPLTYSVSVAVHDDIGQETTADAGTFTVAGRPIAGRGSLAIAPSAGWFRSVPVGTTRTLTVVVRNTSRTGTAPIDAVVAVTGRSFTVLGDGTFTLAPGEVQTVQIEFAPSRAGIALGSLTVRRQDGRPPRVGLTLIGVGAR